MQANAIIRRVDQILSQPGAWTKGEFARDEEGIDCGPNDDEATCWCILGALDHAYETDLFFYQENPELFPEVVKASRAILAAARELFPERLEGTKDEEMPIPVFNDHHDTTLDDVKKVLHRALEKLA